MADGSVIFDTGLDLSGFRGDAARLLQMGTASAAALETTMSNVDTGFDGINGGARSATSGISAFKSAAIPALTAVATAAAAVGTALVAGGTYAVKLASDLTESQNVIDTTFGENASVINGFAKNAGIAFGMSELEAKKFNGTMGAMLKSMQLSDAEVLNMSTSMVGLAGDMASFYNLDTQEAFDKIRSGISGEIEPLKALGINMSVANLEAYALAQGMETAYSEMTQAEQATLRYGYLMSVSADAQGDFAKTSDSLANQLRLVKLEASNVAASIGADLLPMVTEGVSTINDMAGRLGSAYETGGFDGLVAELGTVLGDIVTMIADAAPEVINAAMSLINSLLTSLASNGELIGSSAAEIVAKLVDGIMVAIPTIIGAAQNIIGGLVKGIGENLPELIPAIVEMLMSIVETVTDNLPIIIDAAVELFGGLQTGLIKAIPAIIEAVPMIVMKIAQALTEGIGQLIMAAEDMSKQTSSAMTDTMGKSNQWNSLGKDIAGALMTGIMLGLEELGQVWWDYWENVGSETYYKDIFGNEYGISDEMRAQQVAADKALEEAQNALAKEQEKLTSYAQSIADSEKKKSEQAAIDYRNSIEKFKKEKEDADKLLLKDTENLKAGWADLQHKFAIGEITSEQDLYNQKLELLQKYGDETNDEHNQYFEDIYSMEQGFAKDSIKAEEDRLKEIEDAQKEHQDFVEKTEKESLDNLKKSLSEQTDATKSAIDETTADYKEQFDEITGMQDTYKNRLLSTSDVFSVSTEKDKNGNDATTYKIENFEKGNKSLQAFNDDMEKIKAEGASTGLLNEIIGMDVEEGAKFADMIANMSAKQFAEFNASFSEREALAKQLSDNFYSSETEALKTGYTDELTSLLETLPQEFSFYGQQAVQALQASLAIDPEMSAKYFDTFFSAIDTSIDSVDLSENILSSLSEMDTYTPGVTAGEQFVAGFNAEMARLTANLSATVSADQAVVGTRASASVAPAIATTSSSTNTSTTATSTPLTATINLTTTLDGRTISNVSEKYQTTANRERGK